MEQRNSSVGGGGYSNGVRLKCVGEKDAAQTLIQGTWWRRSTFDLVQVKIVLGEIETGPALVQLVTSERQNSTVRIRQL